MQSQSSWKSQLDDYLATSRVLSTAEIVHFGKDQLSIGERSVKEYLGFLLREELIRKPYNGLYFVNNDKEPVTLREVAPYINSDAVVSLDTVFKDNGGESTRSTDVRGNPNVFMFVPIKNPKSPPKVGVVKTLEGNIHVHSINDSIFSSIGKKNEDNDKYRSHKPEMAAALAIFSDNSNRSSYSFNDENHTITFPPMDIGKFVKIAEILKINEDSITKNLSHFQQKDQQPIIDAILKQNLNQKHPVRQRPTPSEKFKP